MSSFTLLVNEIADILKSANWQLVTAESCTGGMVASAITEVPGSSIWFERGFVTYSNLSKQEMLGVSEDLLAQYGAVSEPVALAMAKGALTHSPGDLAISITGIAGPDGGTAEKPVGLVCFAWAGRGRDPKSLTAQFIGNRHEIRLASVHQALAGLLAYALPKHT